MRKWLVLPALLLALGCSRTAPPTPPPAPAPAPAPTPAPSTPAPPKPAACEPGNAGDYFPYQVGTQATYTGLGNEFASYKVKVVGQGSGKVEWRRDNGGTTLAEVFQVSPAQVEQIYREGEAYDSAPRLGNPPNLSQVILKNPVKAGTTWTSGTTTYTIQNVAASVPALNQTLNCVVAVEAQGQQGPPIRTYFHKQYGIVLTVFDPNGSPVESRLSAFTP
jgi:hypothetical protein